MGPVVLVTLGVLFLLSEWHVLSFGRSWPILVIAIGLVLVVNSATASSHRAPEPPASVLPPDTAGPSQKEVDHV